MNNSIWNEMTNKYSLSKTLRFELKPIGKTEEFIEKNGLIIEDEQRNRDFLYGKELLNEYYSYLIEKRLGEIKIDLGILKDYYEKYKNFSKLKQKGKVVDSKELKKSEIELIDIQNHLRKALHKVFFFDKNLSDKRDEKDIIAAVKYHVENGLVKEKSDRLNNFITNRCTTYFTGFFNNRDNVFTSDEIPASVFYRTINENLPFFIKNIEKFEKLKNLIPENEFIALEKNLKNELGEFSVKEVFSIKYFNNCLNQKGIDKYDQIMGGIKKETIQIKGFNGLINEFSQKGDKNIRKLRMTVLYKQILSKSDSKSFKIESIKNGKELKDIINGFYDSICSLNKDLDESIIISLENLLKADKDLDLSGIYINSKKLKDISNKVFGDWYLIESALKQQYKSQIKSKGKKEKTESKKDEETEEWFKKLKQFSISEINSSLSNIENDLVTKENNTIWTYFSTFEDSNGKNLVNEIKNSFKELKTIQFGEDKELLNDDNEENVRKIKKALDSVQELFWFISPLMYDKPKEEVFDLDLDAGFYEKFNVIYEGLRQIIPLYNKTRNFIAQKPFNVSKFKLNFENSTLLNGWDRNKEADNWSILFRKDDNYYLGIIASGKGNNKIFEKIPEYKEGDYYEKMNYILWSNPSRMLPKVFFANTNFDLYNPSEEILNIRKNSSFTKNGEAQKGFDKNEFNLNDCHKMIDFYKNCFNKHPRWSNFGLVFKNTKDYLDISEFYKDVADQIYQLSFQKVSSKFVDELVNEGKLYLFKIWSKDFSEYSTGKPNLHTMYWRELFSDNNLNNVVYKLNGQAEIFFRKKSLPIKITHPKNINIKNKDPIKDKENSVFKYDLIKDKRYTENKYLFHCPITMNFKAKGNSFINNEINEFILKNHNKINILGIDRGERNLLYCSLLDPSGKILFQKSFNVMPDKFGRDVKYYDKLDAKEKERDKARKEWKNIKNIKELKEGYLSQIIHEIAKLVIRYNAIVILEDLNFGFKRGRFKFEKQVYQKFELKLIEKLNYLAFKDKKPTETGGLLHAYQLTNEFESFKKLGKQSGILYYVGASYTSKIDPKTGFVNLLHPNYENLNKSKEFFEKFDSIKFNKNEDMFEFDFKYSNFNKESKLEKDQWEIFTNKERIIHERTSNNNYSPKNINLTEEIKKLFDNERIPFADGINLKEYIISSDSKNLHKGLINLLKYTLQLRNSNSETGEDYILSCVKYDKKNFFDSRNAKENEPKDADANGAYNIGLKGLMLIEKIITQNNNKKQINEKQKYDFKMSNEEYFNWVIRRNLTK